MKSFCIIGLNIFGETLTRTLVHQNRQVIVIDSNANLVTPMADLVTNAIIGDPTNEAVLKRAGVKDYECAIVCLDNLNDNVLCSILLKEIGVKYVIARAVSNSHKKVLEHIGINEVVFPEEDAGARLAFTLARDTVFDYMEFDGYKLVEVVTPKTWYGKSLKELELRTKYGVSVVAVRTEGSEAPIINPPPERTFARGERLTMIGADQYIDAFVKKIGR
ncbi:MAG: TrkA family potassium uptake protein [Clostridia bacterium]|nr:TrkA family potassium uptake protein [Clostridia bacterium]